MLRGQQRAGLPDGVGEHRSPRRLGLRHDRIERFGAELDRIGMGDRIRWPARDAHLEQVGTRLQIGARAGPRLGRAVDSRPAELAHASALADPGAGRDYSWTRHLALGDPVAEAYAGAPGG